MDKLGLIHLYCGDGKGKTTAAIGQVIRACGAGYKVVIARFLKNNESSEINILGSISNITFIDNNKDFGFFFNKTQEEIEEAKFYYLQMINSAFLQAKKEEANILLLDEVIVAIDLSLIDEDYFIELLANRPTGLEVILTGRNPSKNLIKLCDYVSDIKCIKHPYNKGIEARLGIEM